MTVLSTSQRGGFSLPQNPRHLGRLIVIFSRPLSLSSQAGQPSKHFSACDPVKSHLESSVAATSKSHPEKPKCRFDQPTSGNPPKAQMT